MRDSLALEAGDGFRVAVRGRGGVQLVLLLPPRELFLRRRETRRRALRLEEGREEG